MNIQDLLVLLNTVAILICRVQRDGFVVKTDANLDARNKSFFTVDASGNIELIKVQKISEAIRVANADAKKHADMKAYEAKVHANKVAVAQGKAGEARAFKRATDWTKSYAPDKNHKHHTLYNGHRRFTVQGDCNVVLYEGNRAKWASNTTRHGRCK